MKFPGLAATERAYQTWRARKLRPVPPPATVHVAAARITQDEAGAIRRQAQRRNMAVFSVARHDDFDAQDLRELGNRLGLRRPDKNLYADDDAVSELRVSGRADNNTRRGEYIPYTNRAMGWHTDGYYNPDDRTVRAFILYCRQDAAKGGANQLLDPELAYIHLRDAGREYIDALARPDTFTIPPTIEDGKQVRPAGRAAVFSEDAATGALIMRYTQRKTHIRWRQDTAANKAREILDGLLSGESESIVTVRLASGEGLVCNNALHNRAAFIDTPQRPRRMFRVRYYDRLPDQTEDKRCSI